MFVSQSSLPHLLAPQCYYDAEYFQREMQLLRKGWHVVGSLDEVARPGDFLTCTVLGTPVQVRNFGGAIEALSNVCCHRHCLISSQPRGNSPRMSCQYHGWEYQSDGRTAKIPEPKNFTPFPHDQIRLPKYAVEVIGQLVFVSLAAKPIPLRDFLGDDFYELLQYRFDGNWQPALRWQADYAANWKVPVENSLEAYHVPAVHPHTFGSDPGTMRSEHILLKNRTSFGTQLPFAPHSKFHSLFQRLEGVFVKWSGYEVTNRYWQHHVFPNLLFSFTDAISLCQYVMPISASTCTGIVRQFGRLPSRSSRLPNLFARLWSKLEASIIRRILEEDRLMFPAIQCGLQASPHRGLLGKCEERIHALHLYLHNSLEPVDEQARCTSSCTKGPAND